MLKYHSQVALHLRTSGCKDLTPELIVSNPEMITFRSVTHKNATELDRQVFNIYKVSMTDTFLKTLRFIKSGITWDKEMVLEFIKEVVHEFPNWKPEDFYLFMDMAKSGKFRDKFEQSVDFPILMSWARMYDEIKLRAIEKERIERPKIAKEDKPVKETPEELERIKEIANNFYKEMASKKAVEMDVREETSGMKAVREKYKRYQDACHKFAMKDESNYLHGREEFRKNNPFKDFEA